MSVDTGPLIPAEEKLPSYTEATAESSDYSDYPVRDFQDSLSKNAQISTEGITQTVTSQDLMFRTPSSEVHTVQILQASASVVVQRDREAGLEYRKYIVISALVSLFCFWPFGLYALSGAIQAVRFAELGDKTMAERNARSALMLSFYSAASGLIIYIIVIVVVTQT